MLNRKMQEIIVAEFKRALNCKNAFYSWFLPYEEHPYKMFLSLQGDYNFRDIPTAYDLIEEISKYYGDNEKEQKAIKAFLIKILEGLKNA